MNVTFVFGVAPEAMLSNPTQLSEVAGITISQSGIAAHLNDTL
jgi:hypothetical protein